MRKQHRAAPAQVVVGWTEVWTNTAEGLICERVPIKRPQFTARLEDGHYRIRERKPLSEVKP